MSAPRGALRVLFAEHTSQVSGAEMTTVEQMSTLPDDVAPILACPPGPVARLAAGRGIAALELPGTEGSLKLHPVHTPRALAELARMGAALRQLARRERVDLIHAVSMRAGLAAALCRRLGGPPFVIAHHDSMDRSTVTSVLRALVEPVATAHIANSAFTAQSLRRSGFRKPIEVITPAVDLKRFDADALSRESARARLGLPSGDPLIGMVGQITPWKGQRLAVELLARLRDEHPAARLLIAGEVRFASKATRYDNRAYQQGLEASVDELGLGEEVRFLGQHDDVPAVMRALDVLLIPSWHEPFGRVVLEAMAMATPVVATNVGGPAETIVHGRNGLLAPPRDVGRWVDAVGGLLSGPERRERIAAAGRQTALDRGLGAQAQVAADLYRAAAAAARAERG